MSTTSKEWHSAPSMISDRLYRVVSNPQKTAVWLEVQHVPGVSKWDTQEGTEADTKVLISRLRELNREDISDKAALLVWSYMGGRGGNTLTLVRLTRNESNYEVSTDNGKTWRNTDYPYALALRILELDPA